MCQSSLDRNRSCRPGNKLRSERHRRPKYIRRTACICMCPWCSQRDHRCSAPCPHPVCNDRYLGDISHNRPAYLDRTSNPSSPCTPPIRPERILRAGWRRYCSAAARTHTSSTRPCSCRIRTGKRHPNSPNAHRHTLAVAQRHIDAVRRCTLRSPLTRRCRPLSRIRNHRRPADSQMRQCQEVGRKSFLGG
jgi:hypothetical protein